jgi:hypothetical protein
MNSVRKSARSDFGKPSSDKLARKMPHLSVNLRDLRKTEWG